MKTKVLLSACRVTFIYALLGYLWILFSDRMLGYWVQDASLVSQLQTYKGWFYVAVTAAFLFFLVYKALQRIEDINQLDPLTGLLRHYQFKLYLDDLLLREMSHSQAVLLLFLDIDNFKQLNKEVGYERADNFLTRFAELLRSHYHTHRVLGRLGPDQFAIAIGLGATEQAREQALNDIEQLFLQAAPPLAMEMTYCAGVALAPNDGNTAKELMAAATAALHQAREQGAAGELCYFNRELSRMEDERQALLTDLKTAINQQQLSLVYQPQFSLADNTLTGVEVLIRWQHPRRGFIGPDVFIPLAEEHHLVSTISHFVVQRASRELQESGLLGNPVRRVSINISAMEFNSPALMESLFESIQAAPELHPYLQLEITETAALLDLAASERMVSSLKKRGVKFSIDDFGTGFSSLALLKDLPIDEIKIDRSFVNDMVEQPKAASIVEAIIHMADSFGISVVAEGVETELQLKALKQRNCHEAQGYLLAVPMNIRRLKRKLLEYREFSLVDIKGGKS